MVFAKTIGGGNKNYTELVSQLGRQEVFDEHKIRRKKESSGNFKRMKHYASGMVMRSLENFHAESSVEILLNRLLTHAEILYNKKQFGLLKKCLAKAKKLATERDLIQYLLQILLLEMKSSISFRNTTESLLQNPSKEIEKITDDCLRFAELRRLSLLFWNIIHTKDTVNAAEKKQLLLIAKKTLALHKKGKNGYSINKEASNVLGLCYRFAGEKEKSYLWRKKLVALIGSEKTFLHERSADYIVSIGNLLNMCIEMKKNEEVILLYNKARDFMAALPSRYNDYMLDERYCNLQNSYVSFLFQNKKYEEVLSIGEELHLKLQKHSYTFMNSIVPMLFKKMIFSSFYIGKYKTSNKFYNLWLRLSESESEEIQKRLFGLILFYEQGERDLTHYRCRNLRYALSNQKKKNVFAHEVEKFFSSKLLKTSGKKEEQEAFRNFVEHISKKKNSLQAQPFSDVFGYVEWFKNKAAL